MAALLFMIFGWFFHIIFVFFKIVFPVWSLRTQRYYKWIHLCLLCVGKLINGAYIKKDKQSFFNTCFTYFPTVIGLLAMIVVSNVAKAPEKYTLLSFPPRRCEGKDQDYYKNFLPQNVLGVLANVMLVIVSVVIHQVCMVVKETKQINLNTPQICVFIYLFSHLSETQLHSRRQGTDHYCLLRPLSGDFTLRRRSLHQRSSDN